MILEEICPNVSFETNTLECKSLLNKTDVIGWLKTIAGFANATGGNFFIGVEDKSNKLIGFDRKEVDNERNFFNNQVNEHLFPRPQMSVSFISYKVRTSERFIIHIKVEESSVKPVILKYKNIPSIFMRRDGFTNGATYEEIIEMSIKSKKTQYDILPSDASFNLNDFSILSNFYSEHNEGKRLTEKKLMSMGFFDENKKLANGAILFTDKYKEKKTEVQCAVFSGFTKGDERIVSINRYNSNILTSIDLVMEFVKQRMNHSLLKIEDSRQNIDAYPVRALFEGVVNAFAHRDYFLDGTQIQIDMFKDRLEISSPGSFYRGEKIGKTYDLSKIISKRRNELISNVLVSCNIMEAAGTGFEKIVECYKNVDDLHKPFIYSQSDHFTLVLPDLTYENGIQDKNIPSLSFIPVANGSKYDEKILSFCYYKAHKTSEIIKFLGVTDSTYFRKHVLDNLVQQNYLECSKESRVGYYKTIKDRVFLE